MYPIGVGWYIYNVTVKNFASGTTMLEKSKDNYLTIDLREI